MAASQPRAFLLKLTDERRADLNERASRSGISVQAYIELELFGAILPRLRPRRDARINGQEELPLNKSA